MPSLKRRRVSTIAVFFILYAVLRLIVAPFVVDKPRVLDDTMAYERISGQPVTQVEFWAASRPAIFPLLLKVAQQDFDRAAAYQVVLSIPAWGVLALMISRFLKYPGLKAAGFGLVLLFSLERHIASWDFVMMSESLSITALVLFIAACLWLLEGWRPIKVAAAVGAAFVLAFTRDTNAWMLLALAVLIAAAVALRWTRTRALILAAGLVIVFLLGNASASSGERWVFPLGNLITQRVLTDAGALEYFETCGMPVTPALMDLKGKFANSDDQAMFTGPELAMFRQWLKDHGKSCYIGWLLASPLTSTWATLIQAGNLVSFATVDRFFSNRYFSLIPRRLGAILYPEFLTLWIWGCSTLAALIGVWQRAWRRNALWAAFVCLILLIFPHLFLTWHGDSMAPDRHALSVGVQLYLGFWMFVLLLVWHLLEHIRRDAPASADDQG